MRMYEFGHLCRPSILKPILYGKSQGPIRCSWSLDSKSKQQLRQPPQPPKPYPSSKYTRKPQVSSKKGTNSQKENVSYGVNGERIVHLPYLIYPGDNNAMKLPDRRWLGFAMFGRPDPKREMIPLVAFHGTPGTRLDAYGFHHWSHQNFTPVIAPDRIGMGVSTYVKGHSVADHARDVILLMRALGYRKYRVLGTSGGGPFALAIAALAQKGEVLVCGIMAGSAPVEASRRARGIKWFLWAWVTRIAPWWRFFKMARSKAIQHWWRSTAFRATTPKEREIVSHRERWVRSGLRGYIEDCNKKNRAWGFDFETIREKQIPVRMVYGDEDFNTPLSGGRYMKDQIGPMCKLKVIPDTNHFTSQDEGLVHLFRMILEFK